MQRHSITVPQCDNAGIPRPMVHTETERALCALYGGFTATESMGAWQAPDGTIYRERVTVYACDSNGRSCAAQWQGLLCIARGIKRKMEQEAVYVTRAPITAELI